MKQHHQRILRLWRCPECDRTVRLPGRITSRTCRCTGDPTMMQLQLTERIRKFDVATFVSYQTEEDTTPTAEELVELIPHHLMPVGPSEEEIAAKAAKPRRGKAYLRTEIDDKQETQSETKSSASDSDDFGAGIENESPVSTANSQASVPKADASAPSDSRGSDTNPATGSDDPQEGSGRKRKRRRRRRGKGTGRREAEPNSELNSASDSAVAEPDKTANRENIQPASPGNSENDADPTVANPAGKKRRRRRRRRGKGTAAASDGSGDRRSEDSGSADNAKAESGGTTSNPKSPTAE